MLPKCQLGCKDARCAGADEDPDAVRAKWGVGPEHIRDVLALMGDSSDITGDEAGADDA